MRGASETLVPENAPTPALLKKVLAQGMIAGREHKRLRVRDGRGRKMVLPSEVIVPEDVEALRDRRYEQVWACLIDKRGDPKPEWVMRIISRYHVTELNREIGSVVVAYSFAWNNERTLQSARQLAIAPVPERDLGDDIDHFSVGDDMAETWGWESSMAEVTAADAVMLLRDLEQFSGRVKPPRLHISNSVET